MLTFYPTSVPHIKEESEGQHLKGEVVLQS